MTIARSLVFLLLLSAAACGRPRAPSGVAAGDTLSPAPPAARTEVRASLPNGEGAASFSFADVVPDAEVVAMLREHGVRPYAVYYAVAGAPGLYDVPVEQASLELLSEARRRGVAQAQASPAVCVFQERLAVTMRERRDVRPAPGERDSFGRTQLANIEAIRSARTRLAAGEPAVYGLKVTGPVEALRRLAADRRVRGFAPAREVDAGGGAREWLVPGPDFPPHLQRTPASPEVERLSDEEVRARLEQIAREPFPECREVRRNMDAGGDRPVRAVRGPSGEYEAGGLSFRATSAMTRRPDSGDPAPWLRTRVAVTNRARRRVETTLLGCPVMLRLYRTPERTGEPAWDEARGIQCMEDPTPFSLAPGETRELETWVETRRILFPQTEQGRYHVGAVVRLGGQPVEVPAGEAEASAGLEGLAYQGRVRLDGGKVRGTATVRNTGDRPIALSFGACSIRLRAYRAAGRSGRPAWYSERRTAWEGGYVHACDLVGYEATLQPGDTLSRFGIEAPLIEVLGDSLPDGRYHFTASVELNGVWSPEAPAGALDLALVRPPLAARRRSEVMEHRAELGASGGGVTARVVATQAGAGAAAVRYAHECPIVLYAYRSRERRDAAPRSGAPDWKSRDDCGPGLREYALNRGERRTFELRAPAREILGASLPPGRYFFAVAVLVEGRRVFLSAGEAELRR